MMLESTTKTGRATLCSILVIAAMTLSATTVAAELEQLAETLDQLAVKHNVNAYAVAIVQGNQHQLLARGKTGNIEHPTADIHTPFRVGSITKTLTALTLLGLLRDQGVAIDMPVRHLVKDAPFVNRWEQTDPLRIVQLLEHTAGFRDLGPIEWNWSNSTPIELQAALALEPRSREVQWRPGWFHSYSNVSPALSAFIIEKLCGRSFQDCVQTRVLTPLSMTDASFFPSARLPKGYRADGVSEIPYWHQTFLAYGALNASVSDMANLLKLFCRRGGSLGLGPSDIATIEQPHSGLAAEAGLKLGYGLGLYGTISSGFVFYGHGGDGDGFLSRFGYLPAAGRGYFVVINADNPPAFSAFRRATEAFVTADLEPPQALPAATGVDLRPYVGRYVAVTQRFSQTNREIHIRAVGQELNISGSFRARLVPSNSRGQFHQPEQPQASQVFVRRDAELYLLGDLGNFRKIAQ